MKKTKKVITTLTAAAIAVSIGAVSAAELEPPATQPIETKIGAESIFTYVLNVAKNFVIRAKDGGNDMITFTVADDGDNAITTKYVTGSDAAERREQSETDVYCVTVEGTAAKDTDIVYSREDNTQDEYIAYIIKTENGKTLASADNGATWIELEVETQTEKSV